MSSYMLKCLRFFNIEHTAWACRLKRFLYTDQYLTDTNAAKITECG